MHTKLDDYEYRRLIASSWDLLRGDTSDWPDRAFFRDIILDDGQPALDVGCGTGRLLLDYLADGMDVEGVDVSPEMLDICRSKAKDLGLRPKLYQASMEALNLGRNYRTVFVPSSSFQLVTELSAALEALKRFYAHLEPGGTLVMSIMDVASDSSEKWVLMAEQTRPDDGLLVRRWARSSYDATTQLEHTEDRYELVKDGEVITSEMYRRSPATRGYTLDQISDMLVKTGYVNVRGVSGFTSEPASPEDKLFCIFGTRP
jgi:ubiquinone/menaquinone biosynthesis C-methylase UbiE